MSSKYSKFLTALFCAFIGGVLLVSTILPDRRCLRRRTAISSRPPR